MITKPLLDVVRKDVMLAMNEVAKKHGLSVLPDSRITYDTNSFYFTKITFEEGTLEDSEKRDFETNCIYYNFEKKDYLAKFAGRDEVLELIGFATTRTKYPIKMRNVETKKILLYTKEIFKTHLRVAD